MGSCEGFLVEHQRFEHVIIRIHHVYQVRKPAEGGNSGPDHVVVDVPSRGETSQLDECPKYEVCNGSNGLRHPVR